MPYKIVQTIERGRPVLSAVPQEWENDGILAWPKKHEKLRRNEASKPEPNWKKIDCIVKRFGLQSLRQAEIEMDAMSNFSDTETDNERSNRTPSNKVNIEKLNFNKIAVECSQELQHQTVKDNSVTQGVATQHLLSSKKKDFVIIQDDTNNIPAIERHNSIENVIEAPEVRVIEENLPPPNTVYANSVPDITSALHSAVQEEVCIDIEKIFENQKQILENQGTISKQIHDNRQQQLDNYSAIIAQIQALISVQNGLIQKVSALSVQMEDAVAQIVSSCNADVLMLSDGKGRDENIPLHMKPVDNAHDLDSLEKQLTDSGFRDRLKNICSMLCSGGKGIDCAYMLVDILFTRKFICECSWSGGSRGEELKVPLKGFKHVLSFFWSMVHQWDEKYTIKDNEIFFKTILKNAKKRKLAKCERASTSRRSTSKRNVKRIKVSENDAKSASDKDTNEEENAEENEENYETLEENMEDRTEKSDIVEENMENNDKEKYTAQKNTVNNKEISVLVEENTAETKKNIQKEIKKNDKLKMVENKENDAMQRTSKRIANSDLTIGKETSV